MNKLKLYMFLCILITLGFQNISIASYDSLGANLRKTNDSVSTEFSIWSPTYNDVSVFVDTEKTGNFSEIKLVKIDNFTDKYGKSYTDVYSVKISKNLEGCEYYFFINGNKVRDPYAKMVAGANNTKTDPSTQEGCLKYTPLRNGVVIDIDKVKSELKLIEAPKLNHFTDSIVYEASVVDFTIDKSSGVDVNYRGTFPGMVEADTTLPGSSLATGIDHLKELGINHIQIMPIMSFSYAGHEYNWGYCTLNYFIPQQQFSALTAADYYGRFKELQDMVNKFHRSGIRVIMDVVYNHTYGFIFKDITDKYYMLKDITGCGNTIDTENPMVSNMIMDSMEFWADVYNMDGFRFDLLGWAEYKTIQKWNEFLYKAFPDRQLLCYGEPWAADNSYKENLNYRPGNCACTECVYEDKLKPGVGAFDPSYRDVLRGNQNDGGGGGYIFNEKNKGDITLLTVSQGIRGAIRYLNNISLNLPPPLPNVWDAQYADFPGECINYITCHDGLTYWDKILAWGMTKGKVNKDNWTPNTSKDKDELGKINKLGIGILLTSQGIPFFQCGDEFLRTKKGDHNSYESPISVNKIDWNLKAENYDVFEYYSKMIKIRNDNPDLRFSSWSDVNSRVKCEYNESSTQLYITLNPGTETGEIKVLYCPDPNAEVTAPWLPEGCSSWKVAVEGDKFPDRLVKKGDKLDCSGGISVMFPVK